MRSIGLGLIIIASLATVGATFLEIWDFATEVDHEYGDDDSVNWWEAFNGLDIALAVACGASFLLALLAAVTKRRRLMRLSAVAAALMCGLAIAVFPDMIQDDTEYFRIGVGLWIVAGTGVIALAGAILVSLTDSD